MKTKMSWLTSGLLIWLGILVFGALAYIATIASLPEAGDLHWVSIGGGLIVIALYCITLGGILAHYRQAPAAKWGPVVGFVSIAFTVLLTFVEARMLADLANYYANTLFSVVTSEGTSGPYYYSLNIDINGMLIRMLVSQIILGALLFLEYRMESRPVLPEQGAATG